MQQGKVDGALVQLQQLAESGPTDLLTLNRIGDLLARQGRTGEAIGYYLQIANQFLDAGYVPKAIAIHKKILRLDPSSVQSFIQLGELYMEQKLPAEAVPQNTTIITPTRNTSTNLFCIITGLTLTEENKAL